MQTLEWRRYHVGSCRHPECMVHVDRGPIARPFPALAFRITHPVHGHMLFDTGYSEHFMQETRPWPERLYRMITPVDFRSEDSLRSQLEGESILHRDIRKVFVSHLHGDHVGGLADFPNARFWCARSAVDDLQQRGRWSALRNGLLPGLLGDTFESRSDWIEACPKRVLPDAFSDFGNGYDLLGDGSLLAIPLPGHAVGQHGVLFRDHAGWVFLVADASWSSRALRDDVLPPRLTTAWLGDTSAYRDTFRKLQALAQRMPGLRIVPSHCNEWLPDAR